MLNSKVEEEFVAPLTALRGSLEILRDAVNAGQSGAHSLEADIYSSRKGALVSIEEMKAVQASA